MSKYDVGVKYYGRYTHKATGGFYRVSALHHHYLSPGWAVEVEYFDVMDPHHKFHRPVDSFLEKFMEQP